MNKENSAGGMGVKVGTSGFELKVADGNIAYSNLYSVLPDFGINNSLITSGGTANSDTVQWRISGNSDTLRPGKQGVLEFTIVSNGADANNLNYDLDIICYEAVTSGTGDNTAITELSEITASSNHSPEQKSGATHLKSHLLFFKNRTGTGNSNYQYNDFISNINNFTLTPEATGVEGEYTAKIYWIWPNTIGQILLDSSQQDDCNYLGAGVVSLLNSNGETNDRANITAYLTSNASSVFSGTTAYGSLISSLYTKRTAQQHYQSDYDSLSLGYNTADLIIGKNVDYVTVLLQASAT